MTVLVRFDPLQLPLRLSDGAIRRDECALARRMGLMPKCGPGYWLSAGRSCTYRKRNSGQVGACALNPGCCPQMLEGFHSTVEQYFGPNAQLPEVDMVSTEFVPGTRSFKLIIETPLAGALTGLEGKTIETARHAIGLPEDTSLTNLGVPFFAHDMNQHGRCAHINPWCDGPRWRARIAAHCGADVCV